MRKYAIYHLAGAKLAVGVLHCRTVRESTLGTERDESGEATMSEGELHFNLAEHGASALEGVIAGCVHEHVAEFVCVLHAEPFYKAPIRAEVAEGEATPHGQLAGGNRRRREHPSGFHGVRFHTPD